MLAAAHRNLLEIFRAGLAAADPERAVRANVSRVGDMLRVGDCDYDLSRGRVYVVGFGKAAAGMARALEDALGDRIADGAVTVKTGHGLELKRVRVTEAAHPVPDAEGMRGARRIVEILEKAGREDLALCCISGGGSALLPLPAEGVTLTDKQAATKQLLACGATIREVNCVRKHLSAVKGGQLARLAAPAQVATLILSDVIGDPLDAIASGPTAPDPTTYADALGIIEQYGIAASVPGAVLAHLRAGAGGKKPETPKPGDPIFERVNNVLVATNRGAVEAAARRAQELGYRPLVLSTTVQGEAREVAQVLAAIARECRESGRPAKPPVCLISGGETTVTLRGKGRGGRNQELALAAAIALDEVPGVSLLAAGTDGTDGPTDAAGAFADGDTARRAVERGLKPTDYLARNDSYAFFDRMGLLLKTGPTGTNVMDLYILLVERAREEGR